MPPGDGSRRSFRRRRFVSRRGCRRLSGAAVYLKIESVLPSHAFKIRGAFNAALNLKERHGTTTTLVTASAGNHGRAMAIAAERLGLHVVVFTPATAPDVKKAAIRAHGAVLDDTPLRITTPPSAPRVSTRRATTPSTSRPTTIPTSSPAPGRLRIEVLEALPDLDVIVIPLGGGGLASGMSASPSRPRPRASK